MTTDQLKRCKSCGETKPLESFYVGGGGWVFTRCKACCIDASKRAYRRNPEHIKNLVRGYRAAQARRLAETPSEPQATHAAQAPTAAPGGPKVSR